ncbi:MAG: peptidoglycan-binding protein [Alphaproteobacteria bacterium]|nr:peptidoglycan-binding protein [Alphaproteobacteria bacterium]MBF0251710.1 peptidoglycan-binding protein [Alphaproteobacteria bacterium]
MFGPFKLKSPMGRSYNVDLDDTLRTKHAFHDLGYYQPPAHGMNEYPDTGIFNAIKQFQTDHGLRVDGVMKPGGQTANALGTVLAKQGKSKPVGNPMEAGPNMPVIEPPKVDRNMREINRIFWPNSRPYIDETGKLIDKGINPRDGLPFPRRRGI